MEPVKRGTRCHGIHRRQLVRAMDQRKRNVNYVHRRRFSVDVSMYREPGRSPARNEKQLRKFDENADGEFRTPRRSDEYSRRGCKPVSVFTAVIDRTRVTRLIPVNQPGYRSALAILVLRIHPDIYYSRSCRFAYHTRITFPISSRVSVINA